MFPMLFDPTQYMTAWQNMLKPQAQAQSFDPFSMMQQSFAMWQNMLGLPQQSKPESASTWMAPKVTVMTIELGDMRQYMEPAMAMFTMWQNALTGQQQQLQNTFNNQFQAQMMGMGRRA